MVAGMLNIDKPVLIGIFWQSVGYSALIGTVLRGINLGRIEFL